MGRKIVTYAVKEWCVYVYVCTLYVFKCVRLTMINSFTRFQFKLSTFLCVVYVYTNVIMQYFSVFVRNTARPIHHHHHCNIQSATGCVFFLFLVRGDIELVVEVTDLLDCCFRTSK